MFGRRLPLLPPRQLPWPLKPLDSAETSLSYDELGRMVMSIRHDLIKGVSPQMLAWWFAHIAGDMEIAGAPMNKYLAWHPLDHIHWELARPDAQGGAGRGARFRIVEQFARDPAFYVDVTETVTRLDDDGITLVGTRAGIPVTRLNHDFIAMGNDTLYLSTLTMGAATPGLRAVINPVIHRVLFSEAMGRAWLRHNVEEVGLFEHFLPGLYARRDA